MSLMKAKEKKPYVVYLTRKSMIWGGDNLKELLTIEFAGDVFSDLEFTNLRSLNNQVLTVVEQYSLKPDRVIFVLNQELYFTQQFATTAEEEIKSFLSFVPFDEVVSKRLPNTSGQQVVAVSKDLVSPLVEVFAHHGFDVLMVLPDFVANANLTTPEQFTPEVIDAIITALLMIEPFSFYTPPKIQEGMTSIRDSEGNIFNPRLIGMIVFFVVLIIVLVVILFTNGYIGGPKKKAVAPPPLAPVEVIEPTATVTPLDVIATSSAQTSEISEASVSAQFANIQKEIVIEVLNSTSASVSATQVQARLSAGGFTGVRTGNSSSAGQNTLVLYRPSVTAGSLEAITQVLEALGLKNSAQQNPDLDEVDVRILIGR